MPGWIPGTQVGSLHWVGPADAVGDAMIDPAVMMAASTATVDRTRLFSHGRESNSRFRRGSLPAEIGSGVMRGHTIAAVAVAAITVAASLNAGAPTAYASNFGNELNGTYRVTTNGEFAKVNEVFKDVPTIVETWTLSSSCVSPIECEGTAASSAGWTARLWYGYPNTYWVVDRDIPDWQFCPDGLVAPGEQRFQFWGFDPISGERDMKITNFMVGRQRTNSPSGSCGRNLPLVIETPLKLEQLS